MRAVLFAVVVVVVCVGSVQAAKLTPLEADPLGYYIANGAGSIKATGPRYEDGTKIAIVSDTNTFNVGTIYSGGTDDLFVMPGAAVADPVYHPTQGIIGLTDGSIGASIIYETMIPDDGTGGGPGGGDGSDVGNLYTNSVRMAFGSTLRLQANPVTWQNNPSFPSGQDDNETFETGAWLSAATHSADDFIYFSIDPVFDEQVGDPITVKLDHYRESNQYNNYGNNGYGGNMLVSNAFTINDVPVSDNGGVFDAQIGDVIGIKLSMELHFSGGGQIQQPPAMMNQWMTVAAVDGFANATIDIPLTAGVTQQAPLMPDRITGNTNTSFFEGLTINSGSIGILTPVWIDPDIAIGYDLTVTGAGVTAIVLPDLLWGYAPCQIWYDDGSGPTLLTYYDEWDDAWYADFLPGVEIQFPHAVTAFGITGIDPLLELDPANPAAFPLGLIFDGPATGVTVTMTPQSIPEPTTMALLALGGAGLVRRHRPRQ